MRDSTNKRTPAIRRISKLPRSVRRRVVRETLAAMCEHERLALSLYHYEKLGPSGIAEALEVSRSEADRLLAAGSQQVTRALEREEGLTHGDDYRFAA